MRYTSYWTGSTLLEGSELEIVSELVMELFGVEEEALEDEGGNEVVDMIDDDDDDEEDDEDVVAIVVAKVPSPCQ